MGGLFVKNAGVVSLRWLPLRRFFDLQYASVEYCLRRSIADQASEGFADQTDGDPVTRVLDFGAGFAPYQALFLRARFRLETLDAFVPATYRSWSEVPANARYDLILAIEALEHLRDPEEFFAGARARLGPTGELWVSVPYSVRIHPCPDDWHRWTPQGLRRLFGEAGFEVIELTARGPSPRAICAKIAYANFQLLRTPARAIFGVLLLPLTVFLLLTAHAFVAKARAEDDDPLGFFVRARRASP